MKLTTVDMIIRDVSAVSSGTLSTLTGIKSYPKLDALRLELNEAAPACLAARPEGFENFYDFWEFYQDREADHCEKPVANLSEAFGLLGATKKSNSVIVTFDLIMIAEEEISFAKQRHPDRADDLHDQFMALGNGMERFLYKDEIFRAHCREVLERFATGQAAQPSAAEVLLVLVSMSLQGPLRPAATWAYAETFDYVYRRLLGRKTFPSDIDAKTLISSVQGFTHKDEKDHLLASIRRRIPAP